MWKEADNNSGYLERGNYKNNQVTYKTKQTKCFVHIELIQQQQLNLQLPYL